MTSEALRRHVRWVNAENDAWGSNRACGRSSFRSIVSAAEDICNNGYPAYAASEYINDLQAADPTQWDINELDEEPRS